MKRLFVVLFLVCFLFATPCIATVIEYNVITGETIERDYTQKELDDIAVMVANSAERKVVNDKKRDIEFKRNEAIEEILMAGTSAKARAYQDAIK